MTRALHALGISGSVDVALVLLAIGIGVGLSRLILRPLLREAWLLFHDEPKRRPAQPKVEPMSPDELLLRFGRATFGKPGAVSIHRDPIVFARKDGQKNQPRTH